MGQLLIVVYPIQTGLCCREPTQSAGGSNNNNNNPANPVTSSSSDVSSHKNIGLLPNTDCGPISTNKVAGGEKAGLGEFPWMVLLRYNTKSVYM